MRFSSAIIAVECTFSFSAKEKVRKRTLRQVAVRRLRCRFRCLAASGSTSRRKGFAHQTVTRLIVGTYTPSPQFSINTSIGAEMFADRGKENAGFPRQRAAGAITVLSAIGFCVVPTVNFAQQNLKAEARCDEALGGEQNGEYLRLYLQLHALKRHACLLLLALFFQIKKSA